MIERCPECGSDRITCEPAAMAGKGASLGARVAGEALKIMNSGKSYGIPQGQFTYKCKACGKSGMICVN